MFIPDLPLPSRPSVMVKFRQPTVGDAAQFCGRDKNTEEKVTTEFLKCLLETPGEDPLLWTAGDRRTALWWIFINSRADTMYSTSYSCPHCGEVHYYDFDLRDLDQLIDILEGDPFLNITIPAAGEPIEWHIHPLDGRAMEFLESMRANLPDDTPETHKERVNAVMELRLYELACQCSLLSEDESNFFASIEKRAGLIKSMCVSDEFTELTNAVYALQQIAKHGLPVELDKGRSMLRTPPHVCTAEQYKEVAPAERPKTNLLVPFRGMRFIPDMGLGRLADVGSFPDSLWFSANR